MPRITAAGATPTTCSPVTGGAGRNAPRAVGRVLLMFRYYPRFRLHVLVTRLREDRCRRV